MKNYTLTVNERQAQIIAAALDLYSRIGIGQFEEVLQVYDPLAKLDLQTRERIRAGLNIAKVEAGHPTSGSYGITNSAVDDQFRVAYDVRQVVRHRLAFDRQPQGGMGVDFDTPHPTGAEPLASIGHKE